MNKRMKQLAALLAVVVLVFESMNVSAFAAGEMANVTVEKSEKYVAVIFSEDASGKMTFVPVGETVQIPVGTELFVGVWPTGSTYATDWECIVKNSQTGTTNVVGPSFTLAAGNTTITLKVNKEQNSDTSDGSDDYSVYYEELNDWTQAGIKPSAQFMLFDRKAGEVINGATWSLPTLAPDEDFYHNAKFTLSPAGILTATESLPAGEYPVKVDWEYNGASGSLDVWIATASRMYYSVVLMTTTFDGYTFYTGYDAGDTNWFSPDTPVSEAIAKDKPFEKLNKLYAMYGGYTLKEEYYDSDGNRIDLSDRIDEVFSACLFFEKNGVKYVANGKAPVDPAPAAPAAPAEQVTTKAPRTGDNTPLALYLCLMVAGIVGIMVIRKRRA